MTVKKLQRLEAEIKTQQDAFDEAQRGLDAAEKNLNDAKALLKDKEAAEKAIKDKLTDLKNKLANLPLWNRVQSEAWSLLWRWKWMLLSFIVCFITPIGTWVRKIFVWFVPAWLVERQTQPLSFPFPPGHVGEPAITGNLVSIHVPIPHGFTGWFRDEYLDRTTKPRGWRLGNPRIISKRYLLMSLFDGLWWMSQYRGDPGNSTTVTISDPDDPAVEFSEIELMAGSSLIIRPHCIVGVVFPRKRKPRFRKHWRLGKVQSWIVGQLWFFEICGPVRIFVRASRGVRAHRVSNNETVEDRMNPGSLVAFCPRLQLQVRRTESLWQYLGGSAPVFDYSFSGGYTYLTQETQARSRHGGPLAWFAAIGDGLFKLAGF